jgi:hypothetical protein
VRGELEITLDGRAEAVQLADNSITTFFGIMWLTDGKLVSLKPAYTLPIKARWDDPTRTTS